MNIIIKNNSPAVITLIGIYIVEGGVENRHEPTREKAEWLFNYLKVPGYILDQSIPVIFLFHQGELIDAFTYLNRPGNNGEILRDLINEVL